jgi:hypothetical protein
MVSPLGARCRSPLGAFYRSPLGAFYCPSCNPSINLTFAGFTACSYGCIAASWSSFNSRSFASMNLSLTTGVSLLTNGATCVFGQDISVSNLLRFNAYTSVGCTGGSSSFTIGTMRVRCNVKNERVKLLTVTAGSNQGQGSGTDDIEIFSWTGDEAIGVALANQLSCDASGTDIYGAGGVASSTGTITPAWPT